MYDRYWGDVSIGIKRQEHEAHQSPPYTDEVKNTTSSFPFVFISWWLIKHMDNFAFAFWNPHSLTHSLIKLSPSWEATNCATTQELPSVLWNPKVHYRVHKTLHWSLPWARSIQSIPSHPISLRSILILSSYLRLGLPSGPTETLYTEQSLKLTVTRT
jgi:hypothetical protein